MAGLQSGTKSLLHQLRLVNDGLNELELNEFANGLFKCDPSECKAISAIRRYVNSLIIGGMGSLTTMTMSPITETIDSDKIKAD